MTRVGERGVALSGGQKVFTNESSNVTYLLIPMLVPL